MRNVIIRLTTLVGIAVWVSAALAQSTTGNTDLASFHAKQVKVACTACHEKGDPKALPAEQSLATTNRKCESCHGDYAKLAEMVAPKLANKYINPHASHLVAIDCTTCHAGHAAEESFCLQCHAFDMPMPGGARAAKK